MLKTFLLTLCCASCVVTPILQDRLSPPTDRDAESDEIYAAVVNWRIAHVGEGPPAKSLVFLDTTTQYSCLGTESEDCATSVKNELTQRFKQDLEVGVLNDYLEHNKDRGPLSKTIPTDLPKFWLPRAEMETLFSDKKKDGWESFYTKYPGAGGIMSFSRVGFNEYGDRALLYSQISCGYLCGTGHYFLFRKESGKWILSKGFMAWIS